VQQRPKPTHTIPRSDTHLPHNTQHYAGLESAAGLFAFVTGVSILLTGSLFITCWRQFRTISRRQRDRLMDVDALKNVLAQLDLVALLLRNRAAPLPTDAKSMREEVRSLLTRSAIRMNNRELSVLCNLLTEQMAADSKGLDALSVATI